MAEPLRVLMTTDAVGGVLTYTSELVRALSASGEVEVTVVVLGPALSAVQRAQLGDAGAADVRELGGELEWMQEPWDDLAATGSALLELEHELQPDVVHANSFFCGSLRWRAPVLVVGHSCVCSWWRAVHGCAAPPEWDRYGRMVAAGLAAADAVVAPSKAMLAALGESYGELPPCSVVIRNGIRMDPDAVLDCGAARERFVLAAGRVWDAAKNLRLLAEIAPQLGNRVVIAGQLPEGYEPDAERLLGQVAPDELAHLRRRAAVFAAPARYEPFGLSVLEAAADGCALVLGDIPSLRELWDGAAVFVAPDDGPALAAALSELLSEPERCVQLAAQAQVRACLYSADAMARRYTTLYRSLVASANRPLVEALR